MKCMMTGFDFAFCSVYRDICDDNARMNAWYFRHEILKGQGGNGE